jgi:hypothetical protein
MIEVHRQYLSLAELVMTSGADPNLLYDGIVERRTALWMATDRPDRSLITLLIEHGCPPWHRFFTGGAGDRSRVDRYRRIAVSVTIILLTGTPLPK